MHGQYNIKKTDIRSFLVVFSYLSAIWVWGGEIILGNIVPLCISYQWSVILLSNKHNYYRGLSILPFFSEPVPYLIMADEDSRNM